MHVSQAGVVGFGDGQDLDPWLCLLPFTRLVPRRAAPGSADKTMQAGAFRPKHLTAAAGACFSMGVLGDGSRRSVSAWPAGVGHFP